MTSQPTQPLTDERLARIKARSDAFRKAGMGHGTNAAYDSAADVPRLLAEVDRLRAENTEQAAKLDAVYEIAEAWEHEDVSVGRDLFRALGVERDPIRALGLDQDGRGQANG